MGEKRMFGLAIAVVTILSLSSTAISADSFDYSGALESVARDIAGLKRSYPQLRDFSVTKNVNFGDLRISYQYHTHKPQGRGGWTAGVPNPDEDGVWFFVDFHDADSTAQIHTQPGMVPNCIGEKRVSFLILEGAHTKPFAGALWKILQKHGVKKCGQ
jgi:hypothetical protein